MANDQDTDGIYLAGFDLESGHIQAGHRVAAVQGVIWMEMAPEREMLYATTRLDGGKEGAVTAFHYDPKTGELVRAAQVATGGATPCHLALHPGGRLLLAANYSGGSVAAISLSEEGIPGEPAQVFPHQGSGPDERRQTEPHPHGVLFSPDGRFAYAVDLGTDQIVGYEVTEEGRAIRPLPALNAKVHAGAGPRHMTFHPHRPFAYVINELDSTLSILRFHEETGKLETLATVDTVPADFAGTNYTAEVRIHPNGRVLYGTNRGHESIVVYDLDSETGLLQNPGWFSSGGDYPWDARLTGKENQWMIAVNKNTSNVSVLRVDSAGRPLELTDYGIPLPAPVSLVWEP